MKKKKKAKETQANSDKENKWCRSFVFNGLMALNQRRLDLD